MQFLTIAYDGDDKEALARRMAARESHVALGNKLRDEGKVLYGVAILNEQEKMIGSIYVCDFPTRKDLDEWLKIEPYVTGDVWKKIEIKPCRVGPSFEKK